MKRLVAVTVVCGGRVMGAQRRAIIFIGLCALLGGCSARIERMEARVTGLESTVTGIESTVGDITIGGGSDSVTSWIREVGFWVLAAGLYYPVIHRPVRKWMAKPGKNAVGRTGT